MRRILIIGSFILLLIALPVGMYLIKQQQILRSRASEQSPPQSGQPIRGQSGDFWADIVLGQPDFNEEVPGEITNFKVAGPGGVLVDKTVSPNRVYIYDGMNSRVLGYSSLGVCQNNTSRACTTDSDCQGSVCQIQVGGGAGNKKADIVIGQPDFNHSACNADGTGQNAPVVPDQRRQSPASADRLCSMLENEQSPYEGGSFGSMDVDNQGNLYVPDFFNNRVLKYNNPFGSDKIADEVWGQNSFTENKCNKANSSPSATTLCFEKLRPTAGVAIDRNGNMWVADSANNRVLRFPKQGNGTISKTADIVLGQMDFTTDNQGSELNKLYGPTAVRVNDDGKVYVTDSLNNRLLVYDTPITNGMAGRVFGSGFNYPVGIQFDVNNQGIWINDTGNQQVILFGFDGSRKKRLSGMQDTRGSAGVTSDGDVLTSGSSGVQDVWLFKHPVPTDSDNAFAKFFSPPTGHNYLSNKGLRSPRGITVANNQLIVSDARRLAFWDMLNGFSDLSNNKSYKVAGISNYTEELDPAISRIASDRVGNLWVLRNSNPNTVGSTIDLYTLPLHEFQLPIKRIRSEDLRILGNQTGGRIIAFTGIYADPNGQYIWIAAGAYHRVFRVRIPQDKINGTYIIDAIIGGNDFPLRGSMWEDSENCGNTNYDTSLNALCWPGSVTQDNNGSLYIADNNLELHGDRRLMRFDSNRFPLNNTSLITLLPNDAAAQFTNVGTWQPAFDLQNHMILPGSRYNSPIGQTVKIVNNILSQTGPNLTFDNQLNEVYDQPYSAIFDAFGNLYVTGMNWGRVLVYKNPFNNPIPSPTPSLTPSPILSPTPIPSPSPSPIPSPTPSVTPTPLSSPTVVQTSSPSALPTGSPRSVTGITGTLGSDAASAKPLNIQGTAVESFRLPITAQSGQNFTIFIRYSDGATTTMVLKMIYRPPVNPTPQIASPSTSPSPASSLSKPKLEDLDFDFNHDGKVNAVDFAIFLKQFLPKYRP